MNKKVALISSFCDSDDKLEALNENIKKLSSPYWKSTKKLIRLISRYRQTIKILIF
jgi:archaellum component FlaC